MNDSIELKDKTDVDSDTSEIINTTKNKSMRTEADLNNVNLKNNTSNSDSLKKGKTLSDLTQIISGMLIVWGPILGTIILIITDDFTGVGLVLFVTGVVIAFIPNHWISIIKNRTNKQYKVGKIKIVFSKKTLTTISIILLALSILLPPIKTNLSRYEYTEDERDFVSESCTIFSTLEWQCDRAEERLEDKNDKFDRLSVVVDGSIVVVQRNYIINIIIGIPLLTYLTVIYIAKI